MATATFSGRADVRKLDFANNLLKQSKGMSFGQYCASELLDHIYEHGVLPDISSGNHDAKAQAVHILKSFCDKPHNEAVGNLSDTQIKDLIAGRYE